MNLRFAYAVLLLFAAHAPGMVSARAEEAPVAEAQREYNSGHYNHAVDILTQEIAKSPNDASLQFLLGQSYYQLREFNRAAASFETSVRLAPNQAEYHDWLGKTYGRKAEQAMFLSAMGWARKTRKEFDLAVRLNPSNFEAQRDLIRFDMYAPSFVGGGDDRALRDIADLEKIDPLQGQLARGEFLGAKKRTGEADAVFAKILDSKTDPIGVYFEVADYYRDRQNIAKMSEALEDAERIDPDDRRLKFYHGVLLAMKGDNPTEARALLRSYLATVPDNSDLPAHSSALECIGKIYEGQGRFSEAAEQYRASLALDPHNKAVEDALKRVVKK